MNCRRLEARRHRLLLELGECDRLVRSELIQNSTHTAAVAPAYADVVVVLPLVRFLFSEWRNS